MHAMELLGDVGLVESCFGPLGGSQSGSVDAKTHSINNNNLMAKSCYLELDAVAARTLVNR